MRLLSLSVSHRHRRGPANSVAEVWLRQRVRIGLPLVLLCGWLASPTPRALAVGGVVAVVGLVVRGFAASHLAKHSALTTSGPYALTRNPLYFGSMIIVAGLLIAVHSWLAAALGVAYFAVFYPLTIRREERKLRAQYGQVFDEYAARVPAFWPRLVLPISMRPGGSWKLYRRNGEYQSAVGVAIALALLCLKLRGTT
jgi:protein-S-isoprenylcysteine O-methyltransferase Ste14